MTGTFNLADLFESVVDVVPQRLAVSTPARDLTFAELDERANRLATHLADHGVGADDHVALLLRNGTEYLETTFAAFKIRAVPVNTVMWMSCPQACITATSWPERLVTRAVLA